MKIPEITDDIVLRSPDVNWDWNELSKYPNITVTIVEKYINKPWNWEYLSSNKSVDLNFVRKYMHKPWNLKIISERATISTIITNPNFNWDWDAVVHSPVISKEDFIKYHDRLSVGPLFWKSFSERFDLTLQFVKTNIKFPKWDWTSLSYSFIINLDFVLENPNLPWDWYGISLNPSIKERDIIYHKYNEYMEHNLNWYALSFNTSVSKKLWKIFNK